MYMASYKLSEKEIQALAIIDKFLKERAHIEETTHYGIVAEKIRHVMDIPANSGTLSRLLYQVSEDNFSQEAGMLSAVVTSADTDEPGDGFFNAAQDLYELKAPPEDRSKFYLKELEKVHKYWSKQPA